MAKRGSASPSVSITSMITAAAVLRALMICFGDWQDQHFAVKYTDIDYAVFTDAAQAVINGASPFTRSTYRYSPLLAYLMIPNILVHRSFGKALFASAELLAGYLTNLILKSRGVPTSSSYIYIAVGLFNPFTFTVATRGSCESLVSCGLLAVIILLSQPGSRFIIPASVLFGLLVHFRIYPIIYTLPILLLLGSREPSASREARVSKTDERLVEENQHQSSQSHTDHTPRDIIRRRPATASATSSTKTTAATVAQSKEMRERGGAWTLEGERNSISNEAKGGTVRGRSWVAGGRPRVTGECVLFGAVSGGTFLALTGLFWWGYGDEFLEEALLYHARRADPRHNFSPFFYPTYLALSQANGASRMMLSALGRVLAFAPQAAVQLALALRFGQEDLPFCFFVQTVAFVTFNKVVTAQYFVWYFCLLPLILPFSSLSWRGHGALCGILWCFAQGHWLAWAYMLEFKGRNVFLPLWVASIVFFFVNVYVLCAIISHHRSPQSLHMLSKKAER